MSTPTLLHSHTPQIPSPLIPLFNPPHRHHRTPHHRFPLQALPPPFSFSITTTALCRSSLSSTHFQSSQDHQHHHLQEIDYDDDDDEFVVGDCVVFEDGVFEDPYLRPGYYFDPPSFDRPRNKKSADIQPEDLVPEKWKEVVVEINMDKKERRKIAQELQFGSRVAKKKLESMPLRNVNVEVFNRYKETKLAELRPLVLDNPPPHAAAAAEEETDHGEFEAESRESEAITPSSTRVPPKNPRQAAYGGTMDDISEFFNSGKYEPRSGRGTAEATEGRAKLFTKEEKLLLNKRIPDLQGAASSKWLPLHTLAASGEFYRMDALLKHNVDINGADKDGLTALHRAIIGTKLAIASYLLRESANPFVRDKEGASLMHYAVQTASIPTIKTLLLYNVDINLQDRDGWTPLHLAVQSRRTDIVRLLLIKGADVTIKNVNGLTPLELCLYSGHDIVTYMLIKLLKRPPQPTMLGLPLSAVRNRKYELSQSAVRNRQFELPQSAARNRKLRLPQKAVRDRKPG